MQHHKLNNFHIIFHLIKYCQYQDHQYISRQNKSMCNLKY